jgi:hypothetical protein
MVQDADVRQNSPGEWGSDQGCWGLWEWTEIYGVANVTTMCSLTAEDRFLNQARCVAP